MKLFESEYLRIFWYSFIRNYDTESTHVDSTEILFEIILLGIILVPNYLAFLNYIAQLKRYAFIKDYIFNVIFKL